MSEKRKDSKGRILRTGESQRKDGKYEYKYVDVNGVRRSAYSWKMVDTDKVPAGKRCKESLRDIEKRLEEDIKAGIDTHSGENITFEECAQQYIQSKNFKPTTLESYIFRAQGICEYIGSFLIKDVTDESIVTTCRKMQEQGMSANTISANFMFISAVLGYALEKNFIGKAPGKNLLKKVYPSGMPTKKRMSLTKEEESNFLSFVHSTKRGQRWEPIIIFALGTGCRINEIIGLQWEDCDFKNDLIYIRRGVHYLHRKNNVGFVATTPKSAAGERIIPMIPIVKSSLLALREENHICKVSVNKLTNFVFLSTRGNPISPANFAYGLKRICDQYNEKAAKQGLSPLPNITPHILRHTFCTRYCEVESNVKVIQEIMGHSSISTTMDIYTDVSVNQKKASLISNSHNLL